jgi:hypothetical protein
MHNPRVYRVSSQCHSLVSCSEHSKTRQMRAIPPQAIKHNVADTTRGIFLCKGGDTVRFGDVVMCVASMAVVFALVAFPLEMVFLSGVGISGMTSWGYIVSLIVALFLSALISGYLFAGQIREARREATAKIAVLWAALMMLFAITVPGSIADYGLSVKEEYLTANPAATLSTFEWVTWEYMYLDTFTFLMVGMALVLGVIGLYAGSMLRKPSKS